MQDAVPALAGVARPREAIEQASQGTSSDATAAQPQRLSQPQEVSADQVITQADGSSPSRHPTKRGAHEERARAPLPAITLDAAPPPPESPQPSEASQPSEAASLAGAFDRLETDESAMDAPPIAPPMQPHASAAEMPPHAASAAPGAPDVPANGAATTRGSGQAPPAELASLSPNPPLEARVVGPAGGARVAAEGRVSSGINPPGQYRLLPGVAEASLAPSLLPTFPLPPSSAPADPTPAEALAAQQAKAARQAAHQRKQGKKPAGKGPHPPPPHGTSSSALPPISEDPPQPPKECIHCGGTGRVKGDECIFCTIPAQAPPHDPRLSPAAPQPYRIPKNKAPQAYDTPTPQVCTPVPTLAHLCLEAIGRWTWHWEGDGHGSGKVVCRTE